MTDKKSNKFTSPAGVAVWPRLNQPDKRFNADGDYKTTLRLKRTDPGVEQFLADLKEAFDEHVATETDTLKKSKGKGQKIKVCDPPWKEVVDKESGETTGEVDVKFSLKAIVKPKEGAAFEQSPALFDAQKKPVSKSVLVGGGSRIRVGGSIYCWHTAAIGCGISLRLRAVQLLDLVAPGQDATAYGFNEEEGWTSEVPEESAAPASDTAADAAPADGKTGDY